MKSALLALPLVLLVSMAAAHEDQQDGREPGHRAVLGFVEWVTLEPAGLRLKARLDTGAKTSSLHSVATETFERDGEAWVRFRVPVSDHREIEDANDVELRALEFERPVTRTVRIKRKDAPPQRRYVVTLPFCLNGQQHDAEFSLTDRGDFVYPVLLGRRFLGDVALVDPRDSFLAMDDCDHTPLTEFESDILRYDAKQLDDGA